MNTDLLAHLIAGFIAIMSIWTVAGAIGWCISVTPFADEDKLRAKVFGGPFIWFLWLFNDI